MLPATSPPTCRYTRCRVTLASLRAPRSRACARALSSRSLAPSLVVAAVTGAAVGVFIVVVARPHAATPTARTHYDVSSQRAPGRVPPSSELRASCCKKIKKMNDKFQFAIARYHGFGVRVSLYLRTYEVHLRRSFPLFKKIRYLHFRCTFLLAHGPCMAILWR